MDEREKIEGWRKVCMAARQKHVGYLQQLRPSEYRTPVQPDGFLYCVQTHDQWETVPFTVATDDQLNEEVDARAYQNHAWEIGCSRLGLSAEREGRKVERRPAVMTLVIGIGEWETCRFKIIQCVKVELARVEAYEPRSYVSVAYASGKWSLDVECGFDWPRLMWSLT